MLKVLVKFGKVIFLLTALILMNPHRAVLIPFKLFAAAGSWLAWKLEDLCQWVGDKVDLARENFWMFGKPINEKLQAEMDELNRLVVEVDKKLKGD